MEYDIRIEWATSNVYKNNATLFHGKEEKDNITLRLDLWCLIIDRFMHGAYLYTHFTRGRIDTSTTEILERHDSMMMLYILLYSPNTQIFRCTTKLILMYNLNRR